LLCKLATSAWAARPFTRAQWEGAAQQGAWGAAPRACAAAAHLAAPPRPNPHAQTALLQGGLAQSLSAAGVVNGVYWTGSNSDGTLSVAPDANCVGFTSSQNTVLGRVGTPFVADGRVLSFGSPTCSNNGNALVCIAY
jgi:hypothetical protein